MRVPKGGSDCAKCEYLRPEEKCGNDVFVRWQGSNKIPQPVDCYCCDMFETAEKKLSKEDAENVREKASKALKGNS